MVPLDLQRLLQVFEEREIDLNHDDVAWAFESPNTSGSVSSWVHEYLSPATLLTREERTFFERQDEATEAAQSGTLINNEDFEAAIRSLEVSTASIEKQCKLLGAQKQAFQEIQSRNAATYHSDSAKTQRASKLSRDKARLELEVAELEDSLLNHLEHSLKQAENGTTNIQPSVERVLERDDRLLDGIEKVLPQVSLAAEASDTAEEAERLCQALTMYSSAEVHARIDATFDVAAQGHMSQADGKHDQNAMSQRDSLRAELEELCREIDGLSAMAVENQFRNPISTILEAAQLDAGHEKALWSQYISSTLQYLAHRLEVMDEESHHAQSYYSALKTVSAAVDAVSALSVDKNHTLQERALSPNKHFQKGLKPLRLVEANLSESQDPTSQLLRHLGVHSSEPKDLTQLLESIDSALKEKRQNLSAFAATTERSISDQIVQSLIRAEMHVQPLHSAVYAYSQFGNVHLVDNDVTNDIDEIERKTQDFGSEMRELDADKIMRAIRDKQRTFFSQAAT